MRIAIFTFAACIALCGGAFAAEELGRISTGTPDTNFPVSSSAPASNTIKSEGTRPEANGNKINFPPVEPEKSDQPYSVTHNPTDGNDGSASRNMNTLPVPSTQPAQR